jgi:Caspase domain
MRAVGAMVFSILLGGFFSQPAFAEKRIALAIGNSNYRNVGHLANPANDAATMAATFRKANFDVVTLRNDLPASEMRRALREFGDKARDADIAVIYYAGHGLEVDGVNYLIPIDAALEHDTDVFDEALSLERVLVAVEPAKRLRLIILDACRDNPFAKTMRQTIARRSIGRGLAKVEPPSPNTMIAFAAKAGFTASDGDNTKSSPYATALAEHLTTPGLDLRRAFGFVRDDVLKATGNRQEPFIYGSLGGDDVALVPAPAVAAAPAVDPNEAIRRDYEFAERVGTKEAWDGFLSTYPNGFYSKLAQAQRKKIAAEEARLAATEKARLAAEERARLAAEGAKAAEQAKAAAEAKAAEDARLAAEKKKAQEEARLAEAERAKAAAQAKAAEEARLAAEKAQKLEEEKANQARIAAEKTKAEDEAKDAAAGRTKAAAGAKADKATAETKTAEANKTTNDKAVGPVASLTPAEQSVAPKPAPATPSSEEIVRLLQTELRRVGCNTGAVDGNWNAAAKRSLDLFNKSAGTTFDTKLASLDTLDYVRSKPARICPLICEHGYKADGDICTKISCEPGFEIGDDNSCVKTNSKKPSATRENKGEAKHDSKPDELQPANRPANSGDPNGLYRCGATSCSAALRGCLRKSGITGGNPEMCQTKYSNCIQTGSFVGRYCQLHGLARN